MWKKLIKKLTYKIYRKGVAKGYIEGTDEMIADVKMAYNITYKSLDNARENANTDREKKIISAIQEQLEEQEFFITMKYK
jgi:hypothetical protein